MSGYQPDTAASGSNGIGNSIDAISGDVQQAAPEAKDQPAAVAPLKQSTIQAETQPKRNANADAASTTTQGTPAIVRADRSNLRAGPGTDYPIVGSLAKGSPIRIIRQQADWLKVTVPNSNGDGPTWIYAELVTR